MEKKEFKRIVKLELKKEGFQFKGDYGYKLVSSNYLVGISFEHYLYDKAYYVNYGVVFLPDEEKYPPFKGWFDWDDVFCFTKYENDNLLKYDINSEFLDSAVVDYITYTTFSQKELVYQIQVNIDTKLRRIYDKSYVLRWYSDNLDMLAMLPYKTIIKLCSFYNYDKQYIEEYRKKRGYNEVML